mmetsp:Transcript_83126/g.164936  ORF Transcript_83126/g.164936 Transcript_83126/m.164936 type:complete len:135 (+) Transcript_83126:596-1000(+)
MLPIASASRRIELRDAASVSGMPTYWKNIVQKVKALQGTLPKQPWITSRANVLIPKNCRNSLSSATMDVSRQWELRTSCTKQANSIDSTRLNTATPMKATRHPSWPKIITLEMLVATMEQANEPSIIAAPQYEK